MSKDTVYITDQYKDLLITLNKAIEKTVEIQKNTRGNDPEYRTALELQIEFEKTKLNIMKSLANSFETEICKEENVGQTGDGRPIVENQLFKDVRFDAE